MSLEGALPGLPIPTPLALRNVKMRFCECLRIRTVLPCTRLRIHSLTAQSVFDWLDHTFRWGRPSRRRSSYDRYGPSTLFAVPRSPPSQGCELSSPASSVDLSSTVAPPVLRARCFAPISAADLLSRAPAGTRYSQAQGFHPLDRVRLCRFSNRVGARLSSRIHLLRRQKTIAGLSSPGQPSSWRCFGQLLSNHHPTRDARCPVQKTMWALSARHDPGDPNR
jgi:hypothetical protein